jgi:hypothetical protein
MFPFMFLVMLHRYEEYARVHAAHSS